jgi:hypothetical protein
LAAIGVEPSADQNSDAVFKLTSRCMSHCERPPNPMRSKGCWIMLACVFAAHFLQPFPTSSSSSSSGLLKL